MILAGSQKLVDVVRLLQYRRVCNRIPNPTRHLAVNRIQCHVNYQAESNQPGLPGEAQHKVNCDRPKCVQRMERNTTTLRIVNGVGEKVVEIDEHRAYENCVRQQPLATKK